LVKMSAYYADVGTCMTRISPKSNVLPNKVKIDLDVLGALMLDGVGGHVYGADIVTIY